MTKISVLHEKYMKDPEYREEYKKAAEEFSAMRAMLLARKKAKMSQEDIAKAMGVSQPVIARLESGRISPSVATLQRYAQAVGARVQIRFVK